MSSVDEALRRRGQVAVLRRLNAAGAPQPHQDVTLLAFVRDLDPRDLVQGQPQAQRRIIIGNSEIAAAGWPGPPRKGDRLIAKGKTLTIDSCEPRHDGEVVARHDIRASSG